MQYDILPTPQPEEEALAAERETQRRERLHNWFPALRPAVAESGDVSAPIPPRGGFASASAQIGETNPSLGALIGSTRQAIESLALATGIAEALDQADTAVKAGRDKIREAGQSLSCVGEDLTSSALKWIRGAAEDDDGMGDVSTGLINPEAEKLKNEGNAQYRKGRFQVALRSYDKAIALDPTQHSYRSNRAAALIGLERYQEAAEECARVVAADASFLRIYQRLGNISARPGGLDACFAGIQAVSKEEKNSEGIKRLLQEMHVVNSNRATAKEEFRNKRYEQAEATYTRALENLAEMSTKGMPPAIGTAVLLCNRALCRTKLEKHKEALSDADAALSIEKDYAKAAQMRTQVVRAINSENRAREVADRAMVTSAIRAAAGGVAVGVEGVWGRSMCWQCYEAGVDAVACRTAKKHTGRDFETHWQVGGRVTLTVGGKQLRGTIVNFDWASGLHSVEELPPPKAQLAQPKRTHHLKLRAFASGMQYEPPLPGGFPPGRGSSGGEAAAGGVAEDWGESEPAKLALGEGHGD